LVGWYDCFAFTFTYLLEVLACANRLHDAFAIINTLNLNGIAITIEVYNTLLSVCAKTDPMGALKLFESIKKQKLAPDIITYTSIISICENLRGPHVRDRESILGLVNELLIEIGNSNIKLDVLSYYVLMRFYAQFDRYPEVECLFSNMKSNGLRPTRNMYYLLLSFLSKGYDTADSMWTRSFFVVLEEMKANGFSMSRTAYLYSIRAYLKLGDVGGAIESLNACKEFGPKNARLLACYRAFVLYYLDRGDYDAAMEWNRKLAVEGLSPTWSNGIASAFATLEADKKLEAQKLLTVE
jgi:leucine-rich PPR motif-containing protein